MTDREKFNQLVKDIAAEVLKSGKPLPVKAATVLATMDKLHTINEMDITAEEKALLSAYETLSVALKLSEQPTKPPFENGMVKFKS